MRKISAGERIDKRVPMEVAVMISGNERTPGVENTFTENVSSRGARVLSIRRWEQNDRLTVASPVGNFSSIARVAYCQPVRGRGYAIGLEFLDPNGQWVVQASSGFSTTRNEPVASRPASAIKKLLRKGFQRP